MKHRFAFSWGEVRAKMKSTRDSILVGLQTAWEWTRCFILQLFPNLKNGIESAPHWLCCGTRLTRSLAGGCWIPGPALSRLQLLSGISSVLTFPLAGGISHLRPPSLLSVLPPSQKKVVSFFDLVLQRIFFCRMMSQPFPSCAGKDFDQDKATIGSRERSCGAASCRTSPTKRRPSRKNF